MLQVTFQTNEIWNFLRLEQDQEAALIETLKQTALNNAVTFLNTDFSVTTINTDGTTTTEDQEAPNEVKLWVLNRIAQLYENRGVAAVPEYSMIKHLRVYPFKG